MHTEAGPSVTGVQVSPQAAQLTVPLARPPYRRQHRAMRSAVVAAIGLAAGLVADELSFGWLNRTDHPSCDPIQGPGFHHLVCRIDLGASYGLHFNIALLVGVATGITVAVAAAVAIRVMALRSTRLRH
jgi:hypothetical protein